MATNPNNKPRIGDLRSDGQGGQQIYTGATWTTITPYAAAQSQSNMASNGTISIGQGLTFNGSINGAVLTKPQKVVFQGSNGKQVTVDEVIDFMEIMKRRMLILEPNFQKHELFPALKEAYENYMVLERLMNDSHKPDNM